MSKHVPKHPYHPFAALHLPAGAVLLATTAACAPVAGPDGEPAADIDPSGPSLTDALGSVDLSPVTPAGDQWNSCPTWDCNKNHPMLNIFPVPVMHEGGLPNDQDFSLVAFERQGEDLDMEVENGLMIGHGESISYQGAALLGAQMEVSNGQSTWYIRLYAFTYSLAYWDGTSMIPAYHLQYYQEGEQGSDGSIPWKNLCNTPLEPADDPLFPAGYETFAILIDDERYDTDAKMVREEQSAGDAEGWFNIACAGSALSKMMLLHFNPHIPYDENNWDKTTQAERTATLKMLTADYLGIGKAFTRGGQPLFWQDAKGWNHPDGSGMLEAVWNENGAVCLNEPRLAGDEVIIDGTPVVLTKDAILAELADTCAGDPPKCEVPPTCTSKGITGTNWTQHGLWRTFNPL